MRNEIEVVLGFRLGNTPLCALLWSKCKNIKSGKWKEFTNGEWRIAQAADVRVFGSSANGVARRSFDIDLESSVEATPTE
jgi:hypothetical protein